MNKRDLSSEHHIIRKLISAGKIREYQKDIRPTKNRIPEVITNMKTNKERLTRKLEEIKKELLNSVNSNKIEDHIK